MKVSVRWEDRSVRVHIDAIVEKPVIVEDDAPIGFDRAKFAKKLGNVGFHARGCQTA